MHLYIHGEGLVPMVIHRPDQTRPWLSVGGARTNTAPQTEILGFPTHPLSQRKAVHLLLHLGDLENIKMSESETDIVANCPGSSGTVPVS